MEIFHISRVKPMEPQIAIMVSFLLVITFFISSFSIRCFNIFLSFISFCPVINKGRGMFAIEKILKDEIVIVWGGNYVNIKKAQEAKMQGKLVMQFDEDLFSIEDRGESDAYYINHSCNPNIWMKDTFTLQAMRDIQIREELVADYAMWETRENYISKWECRCGSSDCRHHVTGNDWKLPLLQNRYNNHFIPFINKKILKYHVDPHNSKDLI